MKRAVLFFLSFCLAFTGFAVGAIAQEAPKAAASVKPVPVPKADPAREEAIAHAGTAHPAHAGELEKARRAAKELELRQVASPPVEKNDAIPIEK